MIGDVIMWITFAIFCGFLAYSAMWNYKMFISIVSQRIADNLWNAVRGTMPMLYAVLFFVTAMICLIKAAIILGFIRMAS